jgi:hypothetical protein
LSPSEFVAALSTFVDIISHSSASVILTVLGFALLLIGLGAIAKLSLTKPDETPGWLKFTAIGSLVGGVVFAASGPGLALLHLHDRPIETISAMTSLQRLKTNEPVHWLIRLIAYNPKLQDDVNNLSVGKLITLGPKDVEYTFVAPYEELKGYTVRDALLKSGAHIYRGVPFRVSGIIFPVTDQLIPANSRGMLQIIKSIEDEHPEFKNKIVDNASFSQEEIQDLTVSSNQDAHNTSIGSYSFNSYQMNYKKYCKILHKFRCASDEETIKKRMLISKISEDWHPVGASISKGTDAPSVCQTGDEYCDHNTWDLISQDLNDKIGVRIFLTKNTPLDSLDRRYLIDFGDENQIIPEIGDYNNSDQRRTVSFR